MACGVEHARRLSALSGDDAHELVVVVSGRGVAVWCSSGEIQVARVRGRVDEGDGRVQVRVACICA